MKRIILDLCGGTGSWSRPYREDSRYHVIIVDPYSDLESSAGLTVARVDVRLWEPSFAKVQGILAAPPCTTFAGSGARWWEEKGESDLLEGLSVVDACMRLIGILRPEWWALENPVGRLSRFMGPWSHSFHPWQYGDGYQKRTLLWGSFNVPPFTVTERPPDTDQRIWTMGPSPDRAKMRSMTPQGFARAFYEANP